MRSQDPGPPQLCDYDNGTSTCSDSFDTCLAAQCVAVDASEANRGYDMVGLATLSPAGLAEVVLSCE